ncbi:MAG: hypothetical protein KY432_02585 [Acidobacteria bacterium]|nr:hypothetical protein [Acidobacteriota bacterium]
MSKELIEFLREQFPHLDEVPEDCIITGGPVRDALLRRQAADLDFASFDAPRAATEFARKSGRKRITLGTRFQTERVVVDGKPYDFSPIQGSSIEEDLGRRDFTINALALHLDGRLIDPFRGVRDLENEVLRMVLEENLLDDPLRIVRAPRMTGTFGFLIEPATLASCRQHVDAIAAVAAERVTHELRLILTCLNPRRAGEDLHATGLDRHLFGFELRDTDIDAWERLVTNPDRPVDSAVPIVAMLLIGQKSARERFLERWMWQRDELREVQSVQRVLDATSGNGRDLLLIAAEEGRKIAMISERILEARGDEHEALKLREVLDRQPSPFAVRSILDGNQIAAITGATGPEIGRLKRKLWEMQVTGEVTSEEEARGVLGR